LAAAARQGRGVMIGIAFVSAVLEERISRQRPFGSRKMCL